MFTGVEKRRFRPQRRPPLELGMTPLIDIVFLLLIFFMLTSRFIIHEGIQVDLPVTEKPQALPGEEARRVTIRTDGKFIFEGRIFTLQEMGTYLDRQGPDFIRASFEIFADRRATVQSVVSLLELLRDKGAVSVTLGTVRASEEPSKE
jgi:biopolymer transport protein ExbD